MLNTRNRRRRGYEDRKQKADPGIPKIPDSIRNSAILSFRGVPRGSLAPRGRFRVTTTPNAETIYIRNHRRFAAEKGNLKEDPGIRKVLDSSGNSAILPPRSFSRCALGFREAFPGLDINPPRPARKCYLHETTVYWVAKKEKEKADLRIREIPDSNRNSAYFTDP